MPVLTSKENRVSALKDAQANSFQDCLLDFVDDEFKFIQGSNCEQPLSIDEIGAGITLDALVKMMSYSTAQLTDDDLVCIDFGRKLFDNLLYSENGTANDVHGLRIYFGLKPNAGGKLEQALIIAPIYEDSKEDPGLKLKLGKEKVADDVGHGTDMGGFKNDPKKADRFVLLSRVGL